MAEHTGIWGRLPNTEAARDKTAVYAGMWGRFPQRMHDQEKAYSPAFKPLGGYGYNPLEHDEEGQRAATPDDYRKNPFLLNLNEPENVSRETDQTEQTPPEQPRQPQGNLNVIRDSKGNIKKGKCWYDVRGKLLYCER